MLFEPFFFLFDLFAVRKLKNGQDFGCWVIFISSRRERSTHFSLFALDFCLFLRTASELFINVPDLLPIGQYNGKWELFKYFSYFFFRVCCCCTKRDQYGETASFVNYIHVRCNVKSLILNMVEFSHLQHNNEKWSK